MTFPTDDNITFTQTTFVFNGSHEDNKEMTKEESCRGNQILRNE